MRITNTYNCFRSRYSHLLLIITLAYFIFSSSNCSDSSHIKDCENGSSISYDSTWRAGLELTPYNILDEYLGSLSKIKYDTNICNHYDRNLFKDTIYNYLVVGDEDRLLNHSNNDFSLEIVKLLDRQVLHPLTGNRIQEGVDTYAKSGLASCNRNGAVIVFSPNKSVYSSLMMFLFLREHEFAHHTLGHVNCPSDLYVSSKNEIDADSLAVKNIKNIVDDELSLMIFASVIATFVAKEKDSEKLKSPPLSKRACKISSMIGLPFLCIETNIEAIRRALSVGGVDAILNKFPNYRSNLDYNSYPFMDSIKFDGSMFKISDLDSLIDNIEIDKNLDSTKYRLNEGNDFQ